MLKLDALMEHLQKELEVEESFATEVPGVYAIPLDQGSNLMISTLPKGGISLACQVTPCPGEQEEEFYTEALRANLLGEGTDGSILGLDDDHNVLTLSREIEYGVNKQEFIDIVEDFINSVDFWRAETETYKH